MNTATLQTDGLTNDPFSSNTAIYVASRGKNRRH